MAVLVTFIAGAVMYIFSNKLFHGLGRAGDIALMAQDVALPKAIGWYCSAAFLCTGRANQSSAVSWLQFSRSIR